MSKELGTIICSTEDNGHILKSKLFICSFYGGVIRGSCVQLTLDNYMHYIQLNKKEVKELVETLNKFIDE